MAGPRKKTAADFAAIQGHARRIKTAPPPRTTKPTASPRPPAKPSPTTAALPPSPAKPSSNKTTSKSGKRPTAKKPKTPTSRPQPKATSKTPAKPKAPQPPSSPTPPPAYTVDPGSSLITVDLPLDLVETLTLQRLTTRAAGKSFNLTALLSSAVVELPRAARLVKRAQSTTGWNWRIRKGDPEHIETKRTTIRMSREAERYLAELQLEFYQHAGQHIAKNDLVILALRTLPFDDE
jgi:hypothetical protein